MWARGKLVFLSLFERGAGQMDNLVSEIQASNEVYDHQLCPLWHHALVTVIRLFLKSPVGSIAVVCVCCGIFVSRSWLLVETTGSSSWCLCDGHNGNYSRLGHRPRRAMG